MANINEKIVTSIMDNMVKYMDTTDPASILYNTFTQSKTPIDIRVFTEYIIKYFPWPIGVELRRFFSGDRMQLNEARYKQMMLVFERLLQFVAYTLLIQIWDLKRNEKCELQESFKKNVAIWFEKPASIGTLWNLIYSGTKNLEIVDKSYLEQFDPKLFHSKALNKKINELISIRNDWAHGGQIGNLAYTETLFTEIIKEFTFIVKMKLISIKEISVHKKRLKDVSYYHHIFDLHNSNIDFYTMDMTYDNFYDNNSVVLVDNIEKPLLYLNLSPLIIDVNHEQPQGDYSQTTRIKGICVFSKTNQQGSMNYNLTDPNQIVVVDEEENKALYQILKTDLLT